MHYDLHPHNALFNPITKEVLALLDFDPICRSQKARDVGFGMLTFSRTYGEKTERKNDMGSNLKDRAKLFLDSYININNLLDNDIRNLDLIVKDEALRRVNLILRNHYLRNNSTWSFDLEKQVTFLREAELLKF